jgi:hypothetical protein
LAITSVAGSEYTQIGCMYSAAVTDAFVRLQERGRIVFSAAIDGAVYAKHGVTVDF